MKRQESSYYINGILKGDRVILSQAITLIESTKEEDQKLAQEIINFCLTKQSNTIRVGITGVPGVGKSTFIEALGNHIINEGKKVAVLAIDPTSQQSKGSILGDKTRMNSLSTNDKAYIRPTASGNTLGGIAKKTKETIILCEAAGYDAILIETVGVGQSEIEVHQLTDFFMLLMIPGAGDELQGIKRGIMEMADAILINKAEQDNMAKAKIAKAEYANAIHLFPPKKSGWTSKVALCSAIENRGIAEAWELIKNYQNHALLNGYLNQNRKEQDYYWFEKRLEENVLSNFFKQNKELIDQMKQKLENNEISPFEAANFILKNQSS